MSWQEVEGLDDLDRLRLVLKTMPDEELMRVLESDRGRGRDDYPVRAVWNSVLAGIVYQHPSVESLRRELLRNPDLREMCGFDPARGGGAAPPAHAYTRFLRSLMRHRAELDGMFEALVERARALLPGFGEHLAVDGKAIASAAGRRSAKETPDSRGEFDADTGKKTYKGKRKDGSLWEKTVEWFGFKLHLIVDAEYELPVAYEVTRASASDTTRLLPMMEALKENHPELVEGARTMIGDKGYDSAGNNRRLWDGYGIRPVIDNREVWKEKETRLLNPDAADNIVYDEKGKVYCVCPATGLEREMAYQGFEKGRECLKYRCPAAAYGLECAGRGECGGGSSGEFGRVARVPLELDRRIFVPLARSSKAFKNEYKKRTAVERVNSRLDVSFGFERHWIRGMKKMRLRCSLALIVMLALAVGRVEENRPELMRSLVGSVRAKRPAA